MTATGGAVVRCPGCGTGLKVRFAPESSVARVTCPRCGNNFAVRAKGPSATPRVARKAIIGDEPRPFRDFLKTELEKAGFRVDVFEDGKELLESALRETPHLFVLNVYLRGMLGVEVCEAVKKEPLFGESKVVFIGALFRANRYRSNPTNLYGADEYIEEVISADEFRALVFQLFPTGGGGSHDPETPLEKELDEARRLARIVVSDLVLYHPEQFSDGIRAGTLENLLGSEISEARSYYEGRISEKVRRVSTFFDDTLRDYVERRSREARR